MVFTPLWGSDKPAELALDGQLPETAGYFPANGGVTAALVTVPPDAAAPAPPPDMGAEELEQMMAKGFAEAEQKLPGLAAVMEPTTPGSTPPTPSTSSTSCQEHSSWRPPQASRPGWHPATSSSRTALVTPGATPDPNQQSCSPSASA